MQSNTNDANYVPKRLYSILSIQNIYTIYSMTYENGFIFPGESHNFWELSFILHGKCTVTSGNNIFLCQTGNAVIHSPNCFHCFQADKNTSCKCFTISFDGMGLSSLPSSGLYSLFPDEQNCIFQILKELSLLFGELDGTEYSQLFSTASCDEVGLQLIKKYLEVLCLSLTRRGDAARELPLKDSRTLCYTKIVDFLQNNVERNLTLADISNEIYLSPSKIKEIFHSFSGIGIMKYFANLRCEHIIYLLSEGNSVKSIASIMDFSSPYYLSFFFKRETGMTIREHIKSHMYKKEHYDI